MRTSLAYLPALASCATAFVVHAPLPLSTSGSFAVPSATTIPSSPVFSPVFDGRRSCRRATGLWGKKMPPDEKAAMQKQVAEEDAEEARNRPDKNGGRRLEPWEQDRKNEEQKRADDPWGKHKTFLIGEDKISYSAIRGDRNPAVLYLPAFDAPSRDLKETRLRQYCEREDYSFISMEWYGVGESGGTFEQGTISRWKQDAITVLDKLLPEGYQEAIIVGGGVGGWIATLIALERPEKVGGIVGLAADPDFTENLLMRYLPKDKIDEIFEKGVASVTWGDRSYPVSKALIEDARDNLVLEGPVGGLPINCPVRLVHGLNDEEVPYTVSLDLCRRLQTRNVNLYLVKTASHHLDGGSILNLVINSLEEVIMNYVPHEMPPLVDSI